MPLFITQGRFTRAYIKGGLAKPEDRHAAIARLSRSASTISCSSQKFRMPKPQACWRLSQRGAAG